MRHSGAINLPVAVEFIRHRLQWILQVFVYVLWNVVQSMSSLCFMWAQTTHDTRHTLYSHAERQCDTHYVHEFCCHRMRFPSQTQQLLAERPDHEQQKCVEKNSTGIRQQQNKTEDTMARYLFICRPVVFVPNWLTCVLHIIRFYRT